MKNFYTCLVVGAGPSGSSAAYTFAKNGMDVCVIDKAIFPRDKLCGGLLTRRTKQCFLDVFGTGWEDIHECWSNGALFFHKGQMINAIENYGELFFCNRRTFDHALLEKVMAKGADVVLGDRVEGVDTTLKMCRLRSGREIRYRYLIGADGVNSVVARAVTSKGFDRNRYAFAVQAETPDVICRQNDMILPEIYFGEVDWGYGWVFPKKNSYSVGIGALCQKNGDVAGKFREFYLARNSQPCSVTLKGHYIPFGNFSRNAVAKDIVIVGDAAGLVDPITGEGIAYAIESGQYAAQAVILASSNKNITLADEYEKYYSKITQEIDRANMLQYYLFSRCTQGLVMTALSRSRTMPYHYMDLLSGAIDYKDLFSIIQKKAGIFGMFFRNLKTQ
ncbi:MAG: geranylgeranyl reductase family protein [Chlorobium limicola]|uniref:Geranylgeranyl reductase n=1 Tax=Chlorobium limicola (strain DSM 245 / NBRC 103803 / 6330) TaxID=290315 RepID=B3ECC8_CHLL2|nr:geranylgeranyl reductase family protein [Chlorobium limicola]ACD90203.1 geranylgeranyl reductase [Chlorobium limicola DSM 245]NTV07649.1 geranylgeranyl reductase family protein [Chlorobium limicola]NTV19974.1 geranylgeranyl reductase family protein [Chlorobium limicola]